VVNITKEAIGLLRSHAF